VAALVDEDKLPGGKMGEEFACEGNPIASRAQNAVQDHGDFAVAVHFLQLMSTEMSALHQ